MIRILGVILFVFFTCSTAAEAGWLENKLKKAAESVGDRIINDASNSAYEEAKDSVSPDEAETDNEDPGDYGSGEAAETEMQEEEAAEYRDLPGGEGMYSPAWDESAYGQRPKKKKKHGKPRTDLHLSSDMLMSDPESSPEPFKGKIYIDGPRVRSEFDYPGGNSVGMIITGINRDDKVYVLMHGEKTYIESSYDETDSFSFYGGKPCEEFRKSENLGRAKINGRSTVKYRCSEPEDPEMYEDSDDVVVLWIDDKLNIPVRMEEGDGKGYWELQNIREGSPSSDLFKLPAGYKKLALGAIPTASSLPDQDEDLIERAGIPFYPKARFVYGNASVGYRYATSEPVETVQSWYQKKLPSWPVYSDKFGSWILYKGKPGASMADLVMKKTQISVQQNEKLPEWHSLDSDMTTEIVIFIVQ